MNLQETIKYMKSELGELDSDDYEVAKISVEFDDTINKMIRWL